MTSLQDMIKELTGKIEDLKKKSDECKKSGHLHPKQMKAYVPSPLSDPLKDQVPMFCDYCKQAFSRPLTEWEVEGVYKYKSLKETKITV